MFLRFENLPEKKLVGNATPMSFACNKTYELWSSFMPKRHTIDSIGTALYSVEVYPPGFFNQFNPEAVFEKWAAVEVAAFDTVPDNLKTLVIPQGLYAVFLHKGPASNGASTYNYIFREWIPQSGYGVDDRPHFAVMGDKYEHDSADSEEEIWIPILKQ